MGHDGQAGTLRTTLGVDLLQELLKLLEHSSDLLLGHLCKAVNLSERSRYVGLAARYEDAPGNDSLARLQVIHIRFSFLFCTKQTSRQHKQVTNLSLQGLVVLDDLVDCLGSVGNSTASVNAVRQALDVSIGSQESLGVLILRDLVLGVGQVLRVLALVGDGGLQLVAVNHQIGAITDTGWIVISLVVVGKCTPLGTGVDDAFTNYEAAGRADNVSARELLLKVGGVLLAIGAHEDIVQILFEGRLGRASCHGGRHLEPK